MFWYSDGIYSIMINIKINTEMIFEICLQNVFISPIKFSNVVKFRNNELIETLANI